MAWDRKQRRKLSDAGNWAFVTSNLSFLFFIVLAIAIMIASRAQVAVFDSAREAVNDAAAPVFDMLAQPAGVLKRWGQGFDSFLSVYEENQRLREENALLLAKQRELGELERKVARYEDQGDRLLDQNGHVHFEYEEVGDGERPEIDRSALRDLLLNALPPGCVRWGSVVRDVSPAGEGQWNVIVGDRSEGPFDLVVGADGAWSRVRPLLSPYKR